jgi:hypothetical protein
MAVFAFCYQLTIPDNVDRLGKTLVYTQPGEPQPVYVPLESMYMEGIYGPDGITYNFCAAQGEPYLLVYGQFVSFGDYGMTLIGGSSPCTADGDCSPGNGGGGGEAGEPFCYSIAINTAEINLSDVEFQYTPFGSQFATIILAENWSTYDISGARRTLYLCSASAPTILLYGDPVFNPGDYGVVLTGGTTPCTSDSSCAPAQPPVNCTLSTWGYGATQQTWVSGAWSPCALNNGSYQRFQTRYVITPASNGGTCTGATIQYEACTPQQTGTVATLTTPTVTAITAATATVSTTISNNGGSDVTLVRFRLYQNSALVSTLSLSSFNLGISVQFTGLIPSTQYTVDAVATNSTGTGTSQVASFTTLGSSSISAPTISNLTQTGATLSSTFTNSSGDMYVRYGLIFKLGNSDNLVNNAAGVIRVETGALAPDISPAALISQLNGLIPNTQYFVKAYTQKDDGTSFLYSAAVNFTTTDIPSGVNLAQLGLTTVALPGSIGTAESYRFITSSAASPTRSYLSVIEVSNDDPIPGAYQLTTNLQQVNLNTLTWIIERKFSPSDTIWKPIATVDRNTDLPSIQSPEMWTYYQYAVGLTSLTFRPGIPGYYRITLAGSFQDSSTFNVNRELVIGRPVSDIDLSYTQLRQGTSASVQVTTQPDSPEWIPEFSIDGLYSVAVSQSGTTLLAGFIPNNVNRAFSALWSISNDNQQVTPTLTVIYNSPFKNSLLQNSFTKQIPVTVLPPVPIIDFANLQIFANPINSGSTITFSGTAQYVNNYVITSSLVGGTGGNNSPITYTNSPIGTYDITITGTNNSTGVIQTASSTRTIIVQAAAPIISQLPQQSVGRNLFVDIDTLPFINLNGSAFNGITITTNPSQGTVNFNNYIIRYIPNRDYTGTDLFTFRVNGPSGAVSNRVNVSILVAAPSFNVGSANETIVFNSTEVGATRDLTIPITNTGTSGKLEIHSITIDQDADEFMLVLTSGQTETIVNTINDIDVNPGSTYNVKIRVQPSAIGVRTAKLKIDHN